MSVEDKQQFSDRLTDRWASGTMKEAREKAAETFKKRSAAGEYDFETRNQNLSKSIAQKYIDGTFEFSKGNYTSTKTSQTHHYRSSWELLYMQKLDADSDVLQWEYEFASMSYEFEGTTHRYVPDFHVIMNAGHKLVEVKPMALRNTLRNIAKKEAAIKYCLELGWDYCEWEPEVITDAVSQPSSEATTLSFE
jgi:hypothetical protein